jgi:protocatechuate 3,4-dioxygenase beta subunit
MERRYFVLTVTIVVALVLSGAVSAAQPAGPGSPGGSTIAGKVTNSQGGPVEGAKVTVYQMIYTETGSPPMTEVLGQKNTGADGTFTLTVTPKPDSDVYGYVVVRKEGLALGWIMWRAQAREQLDIPLGEPKDLAGQAVDEQGRPLADVDVHVAVGMMGRPEERRHLSFPGFFTAKTDGNGRFVFAAMPAEATFDLWAEKPGRATVGTFDRTTYRGIRYQFSPGQTGIRLTLPPEARIEGLVVEKESGKPAAGVRVMAESDPRQVGVPGQPAITAQDGTFRIGGLAPARYVVRLALALRVQTAEWVAEPVRVSLKAGETRGNIKLQLAKGGIVEVLVKDAAGKPVAGVIASLRHVALEKSTGGSTDPNGLARLRVLPGRYSFPGVYRDGYSRPMSQQEVTVKEGETKRIESILNTLPKIAGVVRDEAGNPLAGVKVEVKPSGREEITTDASGKFEASWDPTSWNSGRTTLFVIVARDPARNLAEAADIDEQAGTLAVKLRPAVSITGIVLDEAGKPLPGARLRVMLRVSNWGSTLGRGELAAGPDGRFEIKALPPERKYTITALADGYGKQEVTVDASDFKDNRHDTGELRLPLANLSITGVVVDANDKPVAGAGIYGYSQGSQPDIREITTDAEGKFTIKGVCAGSIRLQANSRGPTPLYASVQTEGGATDVRIVISQRPTSQPYMPRRPASLRGKPLPPLKDLGIDLPADAAGKRLLVCFWDMGQRPSRYCVTQLAARAGPLGEKGVRIVAIQAAKVEDNALREWIGKNNVPFSVGNITGDIDKTQLAWGVASLPHLILTDKKHIVVAEGFSLGDLDQQVAAAAGR